MELTNLVEGVTLVPHAPASVLCRDSVHRLSPRPGLSPSLTPSLLLRSFARLALSLAPQFPGMAYTLAIDCQPNRKHFSE